LCNGSNSTPDLRDKFVIGAGSTYAVGDTGGSANAIVVSHTHTATSVVTDPGHTHTNNATSSTYNGAVSSGAPTPSAGTSTSANTGITVATTVASAGTSGTNANLPPYYALCYIMKT
jgi:microcystin-dependent protein